MKKTINILLLISFLVLLLVLVFADLPLFSPFSTDNRLTNQPSTTKKILGFLPYWNLADVTLQPELTDLAYFSLTINEDGTLKTTEKSNSDPGFYKLQSEEFASIQNSLFAENKKINIVLSLFENKKIEQFLSSTEAQTQFFQELDSLLLAYPFSGVNLDIEYTGEASQELRDKYAQLVINLRQHLTHRYKNKIELSIDTYAAAAKKKMLWDIDQLQAHVDYIVVMAYDFTQSSSAQAGPVAPLFNDNQLFQESIHTYLVEFAKKVPTHKILLGIPFYGYEWQTTSLEPQAFTMPKTGATASYKRVKELLARKAELQLIEHWDDKALEPYLTYIEDDKYYTVYYENETSLSYKLDYVNQLNLGGIAIWSLGYEGDNRELWEVIQQLLLLEPTTSSINQ